VSLSTGGEPRPAAAEIVSGTYFPVLGVSAALGRVLESDDDGTRGTNPVVVLSYDFWKTQFASAPDVIGRKVLVNQNPMTVIGVAAPSFRGIDVGEVPSLWIPAAMSAQAIPDFDSQLDRRMRWMQVLGRLRPDVTLSQAQAGLQPWFKAMLDEDTRRAGFPKVTAERRQQFLASRLELTPAPQGHSPLRRRLAQPLWVLLAATAVLLGLACLNVAGLFLARGSARGREFSTRLALGASRGRIGRQLLADSVLLALIGGTLGVVLAPLALQALIAFLPRDAAANALHSTIDSRLLLFTFSVSMAAGVLSGFAPALQVGRSSFISALRERGGAASGVRLRQAIVTVQIGFTLILVTGGALFVRTLTGLMAKGPGFETSSLVSFGLDPRRNGYTVRETNQLIHRIYDELRVLPGAQSSAVAVTQLLTGGAWGNPMTIQTNERSTTDRAVLLNAVSPGFFATLGLRVISGRDFDQRDSRPLGEAGYRSAIVNESFVKRYLAGRNPLGARIAPGNGPDVKPGIEVVGVVADFSYRGLREESEQAYFPIFENERSGGAFYVKVRGTSDTAFQSIRTVIRNADPALPILYFRTLEEQVNRSLTTERMLAALSAAFGTLALLLSLVGLYGVMSFVVTQRTREIGIRLALGATPSAAVWLVLRDALLMIAAGVAIALPCVWALGRLIESQLYDVKPTDPAMIATAILILCSASLGAALIPARRASVVSPTEALRFE
jgi:predicted permease